MESITKNRQSLATLRAMIDRAYGASAVPEGDDFAVELGHGWFNVAYRVRLRDGRLAVLKIAPPRDIAVLTYERGMMRNELASMRLLAERADVAVPVIDHADLTHELCDADWFAMPWIDGDVLELLEADGELTAAEWDRLREELGTINRGLNAIVGPHFGPVAGPAADRTTWREVFLGMLTDVLDDGERAGVDLGHAYDDLRLLIAADADSLDAVVEPRFVEWDLWPGNVLIRDGGIVAIIDHERALYGDPLIEAGFTGIDLPAFGDPGPFVRGYGLAALADDERRRRRLYTLYLMLVMVIETRYRGHTEPHQYDWAREQLDVLVEQFAVAAVS